MSEGHSFHYYLSISRSALLLNLSFDFFAIFRYIITMQVNDDFLEFYVLMCSSISKPARLKIIATIGEGKKNVSELQKELDITMSNLSNHLNGLYRAGIVGKEKQGNYVYYYLNEPDLLKGIAKMQDLFKTISTKRHSG